MMTAASQTWTQASWSPQAASLWYRPPARSWWRTSWAGATLGLLRCVLLVICEQMSVSVQQRGNCPAAPARTAEQRASRTHAEQQRAEVLRTGCSRLWRALALHLQGSLENKCEALTSTGQSAH